MRAHTLTLPTLSPHKQDSYFPHFEMAVRPVAQGGGGAAGVMMAMNSYNGVPALASSELIGILKGWSGPDNL
jgi:hypothetical protein